MRIENKNMHLAELKNNMQNIASPDYKTVYEWNSVNPNMN